MNKKSINARIQHLFNSISLNSAQKKVIIDVINEIIDSIEKDNNSKTNVQFDKIELLNQDDDITVVINKVNAIINNINKLSIDK